MFVRNSHSKDFKETFALKDLHEYTSFRNDHESVDDSQ